MDQSSIKHFPCDSIDRALLSIEWRKWLRSVKLYLDAEDITSGEKKKNKLLHLGGPQLQEVAFGLPGAVVDYDSEVNNDVFKILVDTLDKHFSPQQNSCFERHVFRSMKSEDGESLNKFLIRCRAQANKCSFGKNEADAREINIKDKLMDMWAPVELKRKLLEKELPLNEVIDQCQIYEQTRSQSSIMQEKKHPESSQFQLNRVEQSRKRAHWETKKTLDCSRCGGEHNPWEVKNCPAINIQCHKCGRKGHFFRKCRTGKINRSTPQESSNRRRFDSTKARRVNFIDEASEEPAPSTSGMGNYECFEVVNLPELNQNRRDDIVAVSIGGILIDMLIDSGAACNIINGRDWEMLVKNNATIFDIQQDVVSTIKSYASNTPLSIKLKFSAPICIENSREHIESFMVVENGTTSLLGKQTSICLGVLKLGLGAEVNQIEGIEAFPKIPNIKVRLSIDTKIKPVQQPIRRIPIAVESQVEQKLDEALARDIIERVTGPSSWISPMVIVFKPDNDIRICIDMRRANEAILREKFPLPTFDIFMTKLKGARYFSRLDMASAYHQLELAEESRPITTFITHKGLFRYKRLMFGINSAPEIFQRIFQSILSPCSNCLNYIDDIIVFGKTEEQHDTFLNKVLEVLKTHNVLLNDKKCHLKVCKLDFLGHVLTSSGILPDPNKMKVIRDFRAPTTKEEVRSFLGMVTYLGKFISNLGNLTEPLRSILKESRFIWGQREQENFEQLKSALEKLPTLSYFDLQRRTQLIADASPIALGAVLLQYDEIDQPHVISFASKSLSTIERRYSQTEKESLALVWATERFYFYLAGIEFELVTDHKPLEAIFRPTSKPPARIERWLLRLQAFRFTVKYKSGKSNIADPLSRLCKLESDETFDEPNEHHIRMIINEAIPKALSISKVISQSKDDIQIVEAISKLSENAWSPNDKSPFYPFRLELTYMGPLLLRGNKIVMPTNLRCQTLQLAHEGHPGETVMKRRLRSKVWWPQIDKEAEKHVKTCMECILVSQPSKPSPMMRKKLPSGPWRYVALDYMSGETNQDYLLVIIDYYSRYVEAVFTKSTSSATVIRVLEEIFCRLGLPQTMKVDNASNFNSEEFKNYCSTNGIDLVNSPPYWPQANGEVENINKSLKKRMQIAYQKSDKDYKKEILAYLMMYNVTPHGTTGKSPSELLMNRKIRDKIPGIEDIVLETPDEEVYDRDLVNKEIGKMREDSRRGATSREIEPGNKVLVKNIVYKNKLTPNFDPTVYDVLYKNGNELTLHGNGKTIKRNIAHLKKLPETPSSPVITPPTVPPYPQILPSNSLPLQQPPEEEHFNEDEERPNAAPQIQPLKLVKKGGMWGPVNQRPAVDDE